MLRDDANRIIEMAISAVLPSNAVKRALAGKDFEGRRITLVAIGKAAWEMAYAAVEILKDQIAQGVVVTKYGHSRGRIGTLQVYEAGHPIPDQNSFRATQCVLDIVSALDESDVVLFLVSGGGSALFEKPLIPVSEFEQLTRELLSCGADITEINIIRKRFSAVKGGRFAEICSPAKVCSIVLSDIIGDPIDLIASGPAHPDKSTTEDAEKLFEKYHLTLTESMKRCMQRDTPKELTNVDSYITGSVSQLCVAAENACKRLGYEPMILTSSLSCTARDAGVFLSNIAQHYRNTSKSLAFLAGGETVVRVCGGGLGGRNQELALAAAAGISELCNTAVFSVGSDGTDGPTDAAGGYVDDETALLLKRQGVDIFSALQDNDSYHALEQCGGLIKTGPTGTNVNDIAVLLIKR